MCLANAAAPLLDDRLAVVSGSKEVGKYDIADDDTPGGCCRC